MDSEKNQQGDKFKLHEKPRFENLRDTIGIWFVAVVLFVVLTAGIMVYRTANDDIRVMAHNNRPALTSSLDSFLR